MDELQVELVNMSTGVSNSRSIHQIKQVLTDSDLWSGDISFDDSYGNVYYIDNLIGKSVKVGDEIFSVKDLEV